MYHDKKDSELLLITVCFGVAYPFENGEVNNGCCEPFAAPIYRTFWLGDMESGDCHVQQIKIFKSIESDVSILESEINSWLGDSGAKVINVFCNIAPQTVKSDSSATGSRAFIPSDVFMVVVYEK